MHVIIDLVHLNLLLMAWNTPDHVRVIYIITQHFCEAHDSNSATPRLANVIKSETLTNASRPKAQNHIAFDVQRIKNAAY